jgi:hypothetical protein
VSNVAADHLQSYADDDARHDQRRRDPGRQARLPSFFGRRLYAHGLTRPGAEKLEPWDVASLVPHADEYLSGFLAERYQIDLREAWKRAIERMDEVIRKDVRRQIGGDHQRIDSLQTRHSGVTYKHVLLPLWICSYRFRDRVFRFLVNARTGEVQGQRPWSWVKIGLAALFVAAVVLLIAYLDT